MSGAGREGEDEDDADSDAEVSQTPPSDDLTFEEALAEQEDAQPPP